MQRRRWAKMRRGIWPSARLAYDLTGQQDKAQRDYMMALRANPADEQARIRYAVSLGISGQVTDAEKQLEPALTAGDREAWRLRAFIFAMNGRTGGRPQGHPVGDAQRSRRRARSLYAARVHADAGAEGSGRALWRVSEQRVAAHGA